MIFSYPEITLYIAKILGIHDIFIFSQVCKLLNDTLTYKIDRKICVTVAKINAFYKHGYADYETFISHVNPISGFNIHQSDCSEVRMIEYVSRKIRITASGKMIINDKDSNVFKLLTSILDVKISKIHVTDIYINGTE